MNRARMTEMNDEQQNLIFWGLIILVAFIPAAQSLLVWFIKSVMTPISALEDLAWAVDASNPWFIVLRIAYLVITAGIIVFIINFIKEKIGW